MIDMSICIFRMQRLRCEFGSEQIKFEISKADICIEIMVRVIIEQDFIENHLQSDIDWLIAIGIYSRKCIMSLGRDIFVLQKPVDQLLSIHYHVILFIQACENLMHCIYQLLLIIIPYLYLYLCILCLTIHAQFIYRIQLFLISTHVILQYILLLSSMQIFHQFLQLLVFHQSFSLYFIIHYIFINLTHFNTEISLYILILFYSIV